MNTDTLRTLEHIAQSLGAQTDEMPEDRRAFFEGLNALATQDVAQAHEHFRGAVRSCAPPFDMLSVLALSECERLMGKDGRALRRLQGITTDPQASVIMQQMAIRAQIHIYNTRQDERMVEQLQTKLDALSQG